MKTLPDEQELLAAAQKARERAYTPYSRFAVGAAALTASGRIFLGCTIENAAYPATLCAERVALTSAYAAGEREIVALAVVADTPTPVSPCGMCRQVLFELAPHCTVLLANTRGELAQTTPAALLPGGFTAESLPDDVTQ
jgi:cytidine deaminase